MVRFSPAVGEKSRPVVLLEPGASVPAVAASILALRLLLPVPGPAVICWRLFPSPCFAFRYRLLCLG